MTLNLMHNLAIFAREIYSSIYMYVTNVRQSVKKIKLLLLL